jgi:hypothetical protein
MSDDDRLKAIKQKLEMLSEPWTSRMPEPSHEDVCWLVAEVERLRKPTKEVWEEYARLLRRAWCNPSYKPWQVDVCQFEHAHPELLPYFDKWQKERD